MTGRMTFVQLFARKFEGFVSQRREGVFIYIYVFRSNFTRVNEYKRLSRESKKKASIFSIYALLHNASTKCGYRVFIAASIRRHILRIHFNCKTSTLSNTLTLVSQLQNKLDMVIIQRDPLVYNTDPFPNLHRSRQLSRDTISKIQAYNIYVSSREARNSRWHVRFRQSQVMDRPMGAKQLNIN